MCATIYGARTLLELGVSRCRTRVSVGQCRHRHDTYTYNVSVRVVSGVRVCASLATIHN
jgi:hypothetical protein